MPESTEKMKFLGLYGRFLGTSVDNFEMIPNLMGVP
jgi:hypothetical protein